MKITEEQLVGKIGKLGFMLNPLRDKHYSFKVVLNNCKETTYYFIEAEEPEMTMAEVMPCACPHCGLDLDTHDGSGFCPGGTEEFGGRR